MDEAVEEIDALLSLVQEDWRIRALTAEGDLEETLKANIELRMLLDELKALVEKLNRELREQRTQNRNNYGWISNDEKMKDAWHTRMYAAEGLISRKEILKFKDMGGS